MLLALFLLVMAVAGSFLFVGSVLQFFSGDLVPSKLYVAHSEASELRHDVRMVRTNDLAVARGSLGRFLFA